MVNISIPVPLALISSNILPNMHHIFNHYPHHLIIPFESLLDVGCNDGLLLSLCSSINVRVGIDPAPNIISTTSDYALINDYLSCESVDSIFAANQGKHYDLITANNVFAHADDLSSLLNCISNLLSENGYFVFEVSYLVDLLENSVVDYVYHEHLCYHSIKPLVPFLRSCGLYITDLKRIPTKGGSIRVTASKQLSLRIVLLSALLSNTKNL